MEFSDLPPELVSKIFSYLPQGSLLAASQVSQTWKLVAFNPLLWTEVKIDSETGSSTENVREILGRATLLRKLDISCGFVNLEAVASMAPRFRLLNELSIPSQALSHPAAARIFRSCHTLTSVVLRGHCPLLEEFVKALETVSCLKTLEVLEQLPICDKVIRNIGTSCPRLEHLKITTAPAHVSGMWSYFQHLRSLSVTTVFTNALLQASHYCPNVESLEIYDLFNVNGICPARALQGFPKLRSVKVKGCPGNGWFVSDFPPPSSLECFDIRGLHMSEEQLNFLTQRCRKTLRKLAFAASPQQCLEAGALSLFSNLESIRISGVCGSHFLLSKLCMFPKLLRAEFIVDKEATRAIQQLPSMVAVLNTSPRGCTRLVLKLICVSEASHQEMTQAVREFKTFLTQTTSLSGPHLRHLEEQCIRPEDAPLSVVNTSFPVRSETLKYLQLNLVDVRH